MSIAMDFESFMLGVSAMLGLCGIAMVVGAWLRKNKKMADWLMAIGATLATVTTIVFILFVLRLMGPQNDDTAMMIISGGALGVSLFTMGFVMDRIMQRQTVERSAEINRLSGRGDDVSFLR